MKVQFFYLLKFISQTITMYNYYNVFFVYLPVAKVLLDTANFAVTYWKRHHNYLGAGEDIVFSVKWSDDFGTLIEMSSLQRRLLHRGRLIQKMLSNEELSIVLTRQINFDRDQRKIWPPLTGSFSCIATRNSILTMILSICGHNLVNVLLLP